MGRARNSGWGLRWCVALVLILFAMIWNQGAEAQDTPGETSRSGADPSFEGLVIDLLDSTDDDDERAIEARLGGVDMLLNSVHAEDDRLFILPLPASQVAGAIEQIKDDPRVEYVEPNYLFHMSQTPNDPLWDQQWSFRMTHVPSAWPHSDGTGVVVAVIDTGIAYETHNGFKRVEDLREDGFVAGYDFVHDTTHPNDDHGHGTHVAGTIAQATHNAKGVAGIAHGALLMPIKVLSRYGSGTVADISDAIRFAADEGAQVINLSLGGGARSKVMEAAVDYARSKGVTVVAAAGNTGRGQVEYPAAYPSTIAVGAVGPDGTRASYSSFGQSLSLVAPGGDQKKGGEEAGILQNTIISKDNQVTDVYRFFQGTSMAAPHVAAAAALIIATGVSHPAEVEEVLFHTAADAGAPGWDQEYGAGIVEIGSATQHATQQKSGLWHMLVMIMAALVLVKSTPLPLSSIQRLLLLLGAILGGSGFAFLKGFGLGPGNLGPMAVFLTAMPQWDLFVVGPRWHFTVFWASALPAVLVTLLLFKVKKLRPWLIGFTLGFGLHLVLQAWSLPCDVLFVPGYASWFDRLWLFVNAAFLGTLTAVLHTLQKKMVL